MLRGKNTAHDTPVLAERMPQVLQRTAARLYMQSALQVAEPQLVSIIAAGCRGLMGTKWRSIIYCLMIACFDYTKIAGDVNRLLGTMAQFPSQHCCDDAYAWV